jgi:hypothetical protein
MREGAGMRQAISKHSEPIVRLARSDLELLLECAGFGFQLFDAPIPGQDDQLPASI